MPNIVPRQSINIPTGVAPPPAMAIATGLKGVAGIAAQVEKGNRQEDEFKLKVAEARETNEAIRAYNEKQVWRLKFQEEVRRNENPEDYLDVFKSGLDDYNQELTNGRSAVFTNKFLQLDRISDFNALGRMGAAMRDDLESEYVGSQELAARQIIQRNDKNSFDDLQLLLAYMYDEKILTPEKIAEMGIKFNGDYARNYIANLEPEDAIAVLRDESSPINEILDAEERDTLEGKTLTRLDRKQRFATLEATLVKNSIQTTMFENAFVKNMSQEESAAFIAENYTLDAWSKIATDFQASLYGDFEPELGSAEDIAATNTLYRNLVQNLKNETSYYKNQKEQDGTDISPEVLKDLSQRAAKLGSEIQEAYSNGLLTKSQMIEFVFDISSESGGYLNMGDDGKKMFVPEHMEKPSLSQHALSSIRNATSKYSSTFDSKDLVAFSYAVKMRVLTEIKPPEGYGLFEPPKGNPFLKMAFRQSPFQAMADPLFEQRKDIDKIVEEEIDRIIEGKGIFSDKDKEDFRNSVRPKTSVPTPLVVKNQLEALKSKEGDYPARESIIQMFEKAGLSPVEAAKQADAYN